MNRRQRGPIAAPGRVAPGDTVAIVSPSAPGIAWWPHRLRRGVSFIESMGLSCKVMQNASGEAGWVSAPPEARAADLNAAFEDDAVTVVLASVGGNHSNQMLPYIDFELIRQHPKIFQGYSDVTVLHWAIMCRSGISTFYGPGLLLSLAEFPEVIPFTARCLEQAWFDASLIEYGEAREWTDEFLDFNTRADLERARRLRPNEGWIRIRPGQCSGPVYVACLETLCWHLTGTTDWIDLSGAILALESADEEPSLPHLDAYLTTLANMGVFQDIVGLVVGRPCRYPLTEHDEYWSLFRQHTDSSGIPVLGNLDFGHSDPFMTMPQGRTALLDSDGQVFRLLESHLSLPSSASGGNWR